MRVGIVALFVAGVLGGFTPVFIKFGVREFPPLFLTTLRFIIASAIFLPFFLKERKAISRNDAIFLFSRSIFFAGNVGLFSVAIQYTTTTVSQILYTLAPVVVLLMSAIFLKEKITQNKIIGLFIAFIGIFLLMKESFSNLEMISYGTPLGNFLTLCAVISWALYILISKDLTKKYNPVVTSFFSFVTTIVFLLLLLPFEYMVRPLDVHAITIVGLFSILVLGIFSSAVMFFLVQVVVKKTSPFTASLHQYIGPFSGGFLSTILLGEKVTLILVIAGIFIFSGVLYATAYHHIKKT